MKPYTLEELEEKTYSSKFHVDGIGWVLVKTNTPFICNGLLDQAAEKLAAGQYEKCDPPKEGETVIRLK